MDTGVRPLIAGNWKMNGVSSSLDQLERLNTLLDEAGAVSVDILVCPPATLVHRAADIAGSHVMIGGQDCHHQPSGAHTGDISAAMLADAGARFVIVGHSERRTEHRETSEVVQAKAEAAIRAGLVPIVCVGETEEDRSAGRENEVVETQLRASMPAHDDDASSVVIAYEPVWAIGTGRTATPDDIASMHSHIRGQLVDIFGERGHTARILYGGSVKPENASDILRVANVNGALVGGASLNADDFFSIVVAT